MACFHPLAGMNCFRKSWNTTTQPVSYRPLAEMNCFKRKEDKPKESKVTVPSRG